MSGTRAFGVYSVAAAYRQTEALSRSRVPGITVWRCDARYSPSPLSPGIQALNRSIGSGKTSVELRSEATSVRVWK